MLVKNTTHMFYFKVVGNDLAQDRILDGDIVLVDEDYVIHPNDIFLVIMQACSAPVLRKVIEVDRDYILSAADNIQPRFLSEARIVGKVVEVRIPQ